MGVLPATSLRFFIQHPILRRQGQQTNVVSRRAQSSSHKPSESPKRDQDVRQANPPAPLNLPAMTAPAWFSPFVQPLTAPFRAYGRAQSRRPYVTQFVTSLIIYFCGDLSSQAIQRDPAPDATFKWDPKRALRAVIIGGISSIPSYRYFIFLSSHFNYFKTHVANLALKVVLNQLTFAPMFNTYFFGMQSLLALEMPQPAAAWQRVKDTVPQSWLMSCRFWPFVTAFSFSFVPMQHRSVFAGVMAIFWQTYLGILNQRAVMKEFAGKGLALAAA
jgi:protein Mpv17